jgi:hypothetical protein
VRPNNQLGPTGELPERGRVWYLSGVFVEGIRWTRRSSSVGGMLTGRSSRTARCPTRRGRQNWSLPPPQPRGSVAEAFGAAPVLRSGDDILAQVRAERDEWGDR